MRLILEKPRDVLKPARDELKPARFWATIWIAKHVEMTERVEIDWGQHEVHFPKVILEGIPEYFIILDIDNNVWGHSPFGAWSGQVVHFHDQITVTSIS